MQKSRRLLSVLVVVTALAVALLRPLHASADGEPAPAPTPDPSPADATPVVPPLPVVHVGQPMTFRTTQAHRRSTTLSFGVRVAHYAKRFRGIRYTWGGTSPRSGFDCSGFVRYVFAHFGISLAHSSYAQFADGRRVTRSTLRPGDLVFFDGLGHVGIYIGNGRFIHAPHTGTRVRIEQLGGWYGTRFDGARRLRTA
jgi:cell wall-associated NlpC family hydrolase